MKYTAGLISGAVAIAVTLPVAAQMMSQSSSMGGGRRTMINLVSPADSPIQIRRGTVMVGQYMVGMGQNSMGPGMRGLGGSGTPGVRLVLRLYGVRNTNGLITSTGNRFIFQGALTTPTGSNTPIVIDQVFALNSGAAILQIPLTLPALTSPAGITIDQIAIVDDGGSAFAVPGIALVQPTPQMTPQPMPGGSCTNDSDCNDGDPDTRDLCTPMGCRHMTDHMGPGGGPMM
jgi:hypothetical protein